MAKRSVKKVNKPKKALKSGKGSNMKNLKAKAKPKTVTKKASASKSTSQKSLKKAPVKKSIKKVAKPSRPAAKKLMKSLKKAVSLVQKAKPVLQKAKPKAEAPKKISVPEIIIKAQVKPKPVRLRNEDYMKPEKEAYFHEILLNWKKQLLSEMERTVHHMQDEAANFPDPNDRATQEEEFSLELRTRDRERKLVKKIDEAIQRLDNHEYGYCEACGVEIGEPRLIARPTATLCIDCKTIDEIREKHFS